MGTKTPPNSLNSGASTTPSLDFSDQQTPTPPNAEENSGQEQQQQQQSNLPLEFFSPT